ncbi:MAG: helix-turn-helix domain-containing protein [bacterium]
MNRQVYDVNDVMEALSISRVTCYKLIRSGKLRAIRIGNRWKVPRQALDDFLSGKESKGKQEFKT